MEEQTVMVCVSAKFYEDHCSRGLLEGTVIRQMKAVTMLYLNKESFDDLLSDAEYYADFMIGFSDGDGYVRRLALSARRVVQDLNAVAVPW